MKTYFRNMSIFFMALAVVSALVIGLNITNVKVLSAKFIDSVFPLECRVEYRAGGEVIENARVTFDNDTAIIKSGSITHKVNINDIILTDDAHTQRVENATRAFMLFFALMLSAFLLSFSLICISCNYHEAYLACANAKAHAGHRVARGNNAEARPAPIAA